MSARIIIVPTGKLGATGATGAAGANGADGAGDWAAAQSINAQTGTTYTFVAGDAGKLVTLSNASAITLTVPPNSGASIPVGTRIDIAQISTGQVTIAAGVGVTLRSTPSLKLRDQYSAATLEKTATNEWLIVGDLESSGQTINSQTGTTYTLVLSDSQKLVTLSNASAITLTVPPNSSVAYPIGQRIDLAQLGAGQVTVVGGSGVTVNGTPTLKARAQYSAMSLVKTATDTWLLVGDLASS